MKVLRSIRQYVSDGLIALNNDTVCDARFPLIGSTNEGKL